MVYRRLGKSGLLVSALCLGTNTFGGRGAPWATLGALGQEDCDAVVKAALDGGINFLDTADIYGDGDSERRIGQAMRNLGIARSDLVIATKAGGRTGPGINDCGSSRAHLLNAVEDSLKRLRTDYVDLFILHFPDSATPLEETLRTLNGLVRAGKVRYLGCSNFPAWKTMQALSLSDRHSLEPLLVQESHLSPASRSIELDLLPMARETGLGLLIWGPLLGGLLSGKFDRNGGPEEGRTGGKVHPTLDPDEVFAVVDRLREIARARGFSVAQVALAWVLAKEEVSSVLFGSRNPAQVAENLGALQVRLGKDDLAAIDAIAPPKLDYGRALVQGGSTARDIYRRGWK